MKRLMLIDGNSLTYRAYYGSSYSAYGIMKNAEGQPINAVLVLNKMLRKLFAKYEPTHILVAFDKGRMTFRHKKLESYKAGRQKTPQELISQFPIVKEMLKEMDIKHYEENEIEADDIIGSLADQCDFSEVLVVSSDKDLLQLVSKNIQVIVPQNGSKEDKIFDYDHFEEIVGYSPNQVPDIKGIMGDSSDNLPGVVGIGEKGAIKLIKKYGSIENIYMNIDEISGKINEKLENGKKSAFLCKDLATLDLSVKIPYSFDELEYHGNVSPSLLQFCKKYGLKSLFTSYSAEYDKKKGKNDEDIFDNLVI